jgi:hypothetical protein
LGLRLEFVAEVRRAVGKGSARPNMVKGRRRKVSSGSKQRRSPYLGILVATGMPYLALN